MIVFRENIVFKSPFTPFEKGGKNRVYLFKRGGKNLGVLFEKGEKNHSYFIEIKNNQSFGTVSKVAKKDKMYHYISPPLEEVPQAEEDTPALLPIYQVTYYPAQCSFLPFEIAARGIST